MITHHVKNSQNQKPACKAYLSHLLSLEETHFIRQGHTFGNITPDLARPPEKGCYIVQYNYVAISKSSQTQKLYVSVDIVSDDNNNNKTAFIDYFLHANDM